MCLSFQSIRYPALLVLIILVSNLALAQQPNWRLRQQADSAVQLLMDSSVTDNDILNEFQSFSGFLETGWSIPAIPRHAGSGLRKKEDLRAG